MQLQFNSKDISLDIFSLLYPKVDIISLSRNLQHPEGSVGDPSVCKYSQLLKYGSENLHTSFSLKGATRLWKSPISDHYGV